MMNLPQGMGLSELAPRVPEPNRVIKIEPSAVLAVASTSSAYTFRWMGRSLLLRIGASVREATDLGLASVAVRIQRGDRDLFTDQNGSGTFATLAALIGRGQAHFPYVEPAGAGETWSVYFRNAHASNTYWPELLLFCHDFDKR